jgi:hypothetical protein
MLYVRTNFPLCWHIEVVLKLRRRGCENGQLTQCTQKAVHMIHAFSVLYMCLLFVHNQALALHTGHTEPFNFLHSCIYFRRPQFSLGF